MAKAKKRRKKRRMHQVIDLDSRHHAYLNDIGIKSTDSCIFQSYGDMDSRREIFEEERRNHSFDSRETWSLDYTLSCWLYEHLMMYRHKAGQKIDLTYNSVDIERIKIRKNGKVRRKTVRVSEKKAISIACKYLRKALMSDDDDHVVEYEKAALRIVAELVPYLWW